MQITLAEHGHNIMAVMLILVLVLVLNMCALRRESHACCTVASFVCFHRIYPFLGRCTVLIV